MAFRETKKANCSGGGKEVAIARADGDPHWSRAYPAGNMRLRELIVDLRRPEFDSLRGIAGSAKMFMPRQETMLAYIDAPPSAAGRGAAAGGIRSCAPAALMEEYKRLNGDQQEALKKVLSARDYVLLLGMPGTGYVYF
jgi:hypothetical protein